MIFVPTWNRLLIWMHDLACKYPTSVSLSLHWNYGSLAGFCLVIQLVSGIALAMHYTPDITLAFSSVEYIMRDVQNGWLLRYTHANGASFFFIVVYLHMFRGLYYGSYKRNHEGVWYVGVIIFLLMILTAFMGYVLPWGQMSLWGATVITNLVSAVPVIGQDIVHWLWGGFSVDNAVLKRFFSFHYTFPFIISGLAMLHIFILHQFGSNSPVTEKSDLKTYFHPFYTIKDLLGVWVFMTWALFQIFIQPNHFGHADNYILANPMQTPPHIVPEWYLLPYYAILRAIPDKLGGVIAMGLAILILLALPKLDFNDRRNKAYTVITKQAYWLFAFNYYLLGLIGAIPVRYFWVVLGRACVVYYFGFFVFLPVLGYIDNKLGSKNV